VYFFFLFFFTSAFQNDVVRLWNTHTHTHTHTPLQSPRRPLQRSCFAEQFTEWSSVAQVSGAHDECLRAFFSSPTVRSTAIARGIPLRKRELVTAFVVRRDCVSAPRSVTIFGDPVSDFSADVWSVESRAVNRIDWIRIDRFPVTFSRQYSDLDTAFSRFRNVARSQLFTSSSSVFSRVKIESIIIFSVALSRPNNGNIYYRGEFSPLLRYKFYSAALTRIGIQAIRTRISIF